MQLIHSSVKRDTVVKRQSSFLFICIILASAFLVWVSQWQDDRQSDQALWPDQHQEVNVYPDQSGDLYSNGTAAGKSKHFIVTPGGTLLDIVSFNEKSGVIDTGVGYGANNTIDAPVLFTPDDNVRGALLALINDEKERISVAIFAFTDKMLADALCNAHKRGVRVEVVADPACLKDSRNKLSMLVEAGIMVFIYDANTGKNCVSTMHNKFIIFKRSTDHDSYVWTGSCNFTKSGFENNQENSIILRGTGSVRKFGNQFSRLKRRSKVYALHTKR